MVHDRQFYIDQSDASKFTDWKSHPLAEGYSLHYHPQLHTFFIDERFALLGHAWQTDPLRPSPAEALLALSTSEACTPQQIYDMEKTWCGRYLLIADGFIYLDACGLINIFFSQDSICSSLGVLCAVEQRPVVLPPIVHRRNPDFVPGMMTPYKGVRRLLPSQILRISGRQISTRPLLSDDIPHYDNDEQGISMLTRYFIHSVQNLAREFANHDIWVASTGGRDSRTTIAMLHKAKVPFSTFTLWHQNIPYPDTVIPRRIARALGIRYRFIKREEARFSQQRYDDYQIHTAGMAVDEDWRFYAYNQYPSLITDGKPIVILRTGICGIANEFFTRKYGENGSKLEHIFPEIQRNDFLRASAKEWKEYVDHDIQNQQITLVDRIYWELRESCWLASLEQSFDVMDGVTSIQIYNCRHIIGLMLGFPLAERLRKEEENKIAQTVCPALATVPYDYQFEQFRSQRIRRWLLMLPTRAKRRLKRIFG